MHFSRLKRYIVLIICSLLVSSAPVKAQWTLTIMDSTFMEPVAGALLLTEGYSSTTSTGNGVISVPLYKVLTLPRPRLVTIKSLGYKPYKFIIQKQLLTDTIYLQSDGRFQEVIVTANRDGENRNRISQSAEVIKPDFIVNTQATQLQQALIKLPGLTTQKDQLSIRGISGFSYGTGSRVLLLIDDMPLISADASDIKWNYIPLENIYRVEVLKGPAASLYGSSALEGTIQLRTVQPADTSYVGLRAFATYYDKPPRPEWQIEKSGKGMTLGSDISFRRKFGKLGAVASFFHLSEAGYREGDEYSLDRANVRLTYSAGKDDRWQFAYSINGAKQTGKDFVLFKDANTPFKAFPGTTSTYSSTRFHTDLAVGFTPNIQDQHSLKFRYYLTDNNNNTGQTTQGNSYYTDYRYKRNLEPVGLISNQLALGITNITTVIRSPEIYGNHVGQNTSGYGQLESQYRAIKLILGGRVEYYKIDAQSSTIMPVFRAATNIALGEATFARLSYAQGFRYPSVAERFSRTQSAGINIFPNPALNAEKGRTIEVGLRRLLLKSENLSAYADVSAFSNRYHDMIEYVFGFYKPDTGKQLPMRYFGFQAQNIPNTRILGTEASLGLNYESGEFKAELLAGYTYINPVDKDFLRSQNDTLARSKFLRYRRAHTGRFNLDITYRAFSFGAYASIGSGYKNMDLIFLTIIEGLRQNDYWERFSAYRQVDFRAGYTINRYATVNIIAKNAFNSIFMDAPGNTNAPRNYTLQLQVRF